jgi:hypothetical protein
LLVVVQNSSTVLVERLRAAEALIESNVDVVWPQVVETIRTRGEAGDKQLALEIIALAKGAGFSGEQIASAILDYKKPSRQPAEENESDNDEDDNEPYVSGLTHAITQRISPKLSGEILNAIAANFRRANKPADWRPGYELSNSIKQLVERAIQDADVPSPENVWSWLRLTDDETGYSSERNQPVRDWLTQNTDLRRKIQRLALNSATKSDEPWLVIVHDLPTANRGLALSVSDTIELLVEIGSKTDLSNSDTQLWADLVKSRQSRDGISQDIMPAVTRVHYQHTAHEAAGAPGARHSLRPLISESGTFQQNSRGCAAR